MEAIAPTLATQPQYSPLERLSIGTLLGLALALAYVQLVMMQSFDLPLTVFAGLLLLGAALTSTRRRWTPLIGALLCALVVGANSGPVVYDLTHPAAYHNFAFMIVAVGLSVVGCVSGIGAAVGRYRGTTATPQGAFGALMLLIGLCAGAMLIGALAKPASPGIAPELLAGLPVLETPGMQFDQSQLRARVGEPVALHLANTHSVPHSFDIDALNVHVPVAAGQEGLVLFVPQQAGTYEFYCGVPGHRESGMVGTLTVEP